MEEVIPRLSRAMPWDKRLVLRLLSRSWANAIAGPEYDRAYNSSTSLSSRDFIVSHLIPFLRHRTEPSNTDASLWVWDPFRGMKSTLPPPQIPTI